MAKKKDVTEQIEQIPLDAIDYPVSNHRQSMDEAKLQELANSITSMGVQQPIKVCRRKKRYVMIFGHRRVKASELAKLADIPAIVVEGWTDEQIAEAQVIENILREDLNPIEEAQCVKMLVDNGHCLGMAASKLGKSEQWARQRLDLMRLEPERVAPLVALGRIPLGHATLLARVGDPARQQELAAGVIGRFWNDKWEDAIKGDYVQPLNNLRKDIRYIDCKMGAARWPHIGEYAGKRPCAGCPDNSETEPGLFDSLGLDRTSTKGNCLNPACFRAKAEAWEKDPVKLERDKIREAKKKAKAKKNGQDEPQAKPKQNESYEAREKRIKKLKKQFPWNAEQRFALALFEHCKELALSVGEHIAAVDHGVDPFRDMVLYCFCGDDCSFHHISKGVNLVNVALGKEAIGGKTLQEIWEHLTTNALCGKEPGIGWDGKVLNVPISIGVMNGIEKLEEITKIFNTNNRPVRPTLEAMQREAIVSEIAKANKVDALKIIAECKDGVALADMVKNAEALKLPKYKLKAIGERITELSQSSTKKPAADHVCEVCGEESDIEQEVCSVCYELILHGPKKKKDDVIAAIEKTPRYLLEEIQAENPRGDWRRAALAKGIEKLKKAGV